MPAVFEQGYTKTAAYVENGIRLYNIEADYFPLTQPWTIGRADLTRLLPRYGISWHSDTSLWLEDRDYEHFAYDGDRDYPFLYRNTRTLPYAFLVAPEVIDYVKQAEQLTIAAQPVETFHHRLDTIDFWIDDLATTRVLVAQERAYPGWTVEVNGHAAKLECVGGLIGVVLEPTGSGAPRLVRFAFRPAIYYAGAALTLLTIGAMMVYLLGGDRWIVQSIRRARGASG